MSWKDAGAADLKPGETACRDVGGTSVVVARGQDGNWYAVVNQCSHVAQPLAGGRVRGASIVCPHHGARFDLKTGRVLGAPAYAPIAAFPTREREGRVELFAS